METTDQAAAKRLEKQTPWNQWNASGPIPKPKVPRSNRGGGIQYFVLFLKISQLLLMWRVLTKCTHQHSETLKSSICENRDLWPRTNPLRSSLMH